MRARSHIRVVRARRLKRQASTARELLGGNCEVARKYYKRECASLPSFTCEKDVRENTAVVMSIDGVSREVAVATFIDQECARDQRAYAKTACAGFTRDVATRKTRLESDVLM